MADVKELQWTLDCDLKEVKRDLDNITELIQQLSSVRTEKRVVLHENLLLRKELEQNCKLHTASQTKLKSIVEQSNSFEQYMLASENELKLIRASFEQRKQDSEKLTQDNYKLRELQAVAAKCIEKLALKLGDVQARCCKMERDCANHNAFIKALQDKNELLKKESKSHEERRIASEATVAELMANLQNMEEKYVRLELQNAELQEAKSEFRPKLLRLEKMRDSYDERIRKLDHALNTSEQTNVRLNLEIGALNSQIFEVRRAKTEEKLQKVEEMQRKLLQSEEQAKSSEKLCAQLKKQLEELRAENAHVSEELSKVSLLLETTKEQRDALVKEMQQLSEDIEELRTAKERLQSQNIVALRKQEEYQRTQFAKQQTLVVELKMKVQQMQSELDEKSAKFVEMGAEMVHLCEALAAMQEVNDQVGNLRKQLTDTQTLLEKEQHTKIELLTDNQILQTKYNEAKERLVDVEAEAENRIRESCLQMELKVDNMKNKTTQCGVLENYGARRKWKIPRWFKYLSLVIISVASFAIMFKYFMNSKDLEKLLERINLPAQLN